MSVSVEGHHGRRALLAMLAVLWYAGFAWSFLNTAVAPALPSIQRGFHASTPAAAWVLTSYLIAGCVAISICGRLGDIVGKRRALLWLLGLAVVGSLVSALSHTLPLLIAGRAIQGGGGGIFPLAFGIIRDEFSPRRVLAALTAMSGGYGIGNVAGVAGAGVLLHSLSYEWLFWCAVILLGTAFFLAIVAVPPSRPGSGAPIDWVGGIVFATALAVLLLGITQSRTWGWTSAAVLALLVGGGAMLAAWVPYELRREHPIADVRLLRRRQIWPVHASALIAGFGAYTVLTLVPKLLQSSGDAGYGFGLSVLRAALLLAPGAVTILLASSCAGWLVEHAGVRATLVLGAAAMFCALAGLAFASTVAQVVALNCVSAVGIGLSWTGAATALSLAAPPGQMGETQALNQIARMVGAAVGSTVAATVASALPATGAHGPSHAGYHWAFVAASAVLVLWALAATQALGGRNSQPSPAAEAAGT